MEKDRKSGQNGKDGDRRPMSISYEEWERRFKKAFKKDEDTQNVDSKGK